MHKLGLLLAAATLFGFGCGGDDDDDGAGVDAGGVDAAADTTFNVTLTSEEELPLCAEAGEDATGTATVVVSADGTEVTVTDLTWSDLSGPATAAHIHAGAEGAMGGIALAFTAMGTAPTNGTDKTFTEADYADPMGGPADFDAFVASLLDGDAYLNVHTENCPTGEIRGQID